MASKLLTQNKRQLLLLAVRRFRLCAPASRTSSTQADEEVDYVVDQKKLQRLKEIQKQFQKDDGVPVYLKGGVKDRVLYQTTIALTILIGLCNCYIVAVHFIMPH